MFADLLLALLHPLLGGSAALAMTYLLVTNDFFLPRRGGRRLLDGAPPAPDKLVTRPPWPGGRGGRPRVVHPEAAPPCGRRGVVARDARPGGCADDPSPTTAPAGAQKG